MRYSKWLSISLGAIVILFLTLAPPPAWADGVPLPPHGRWADVQMPGQKAIIVYDAALQPSKEEQGVGSAPG